MKPSILNINNYHYVRGGADKYFIELNKLLLEHGHKVRTFSSKSSKDVDIELALPDLPLAINTESFLGVKQIGHFLYSFSAKNKLRKGLLEFKPDIAHLHIYYGQLTASILSPLSDLDIPIVQTLHEYKPVCATHGLISNGKFCDRCIGHAYWHSLIERCNRGSFSRTALSMTEAYVSLLAGANNKISRFIAVSEYQRDQLIRLGMEKDRLRVIGHYAVPANKAPGYVGRYFLYVGRIQKEKGILILLQAYAALNYPKPKLLIVGVGSDVQLVMNQIEVLGLRKEVVLLGHKSGNELSSLYRNCICAINPSLLNETFGLTVLESLAQGRPVIVSKIGALPEVARENESGLLVAPGSIKELADAMDVFRQNSDYAIRMGRVGLEVVKSEFTKESHYRQIISVYKEVT